MRVWLCVCTRFHFASHRIASHFIASRSSLFEGANDLTMLRSAIVNVVAVVVVVYPLEVLHVAKTVQ